MARRSSSFNGSSLRGSSSSQPSSSSNSSSSSSASASRSTSASVPEPSLNKPSSKPCFSSRASRNRRARPFLGTSSPALQDSELGPCAAAAGAPGGCSSGSNSLPEGPIPVPVQMNDVGDRFAGGRAVSTLGPAHGDDGHRGDVRRQAEGAAGERGRPEGQGREGGPQADGPGREE